MMNHPELNITIARLLHAERVAAAERHHQLFRLPLSASGAPSAAIVTEIYADLPVSRRDSRVA